MSSVAQEAAALTARAERSAASGQWADAIAAYGGLLRLKPDDPGTLVQLSYVHSLAGHYRDALAFALRAQRTGTTDARVLRELLPRLRTLNEGQALLQAIERAGPPARMSIPLLLTAAAQLSYLNLPEQAIGLLDEARRADPDYPPSQLARAQVLIYLGRFAEARDDIAAALRRAPQIAQAWWLQAPLLASDHSAGRVAAIGQQLARPDRSSADIALLSFALHTELDAIGDHEGAWRALEQGCRAKRATLRHDPRDTAPLFEALAGLEQQAAMDPGNPAATGGASGEDGGAAVPIFIVGMHRSGTTLLEQMLSAHDDVQGIGELYDFTSAMRYATDHHCRGVIDATLVARARAVDFAEVGRRYLAGIQWRLSGARHFTDKLPSNFLNIGFICRALPQARILHMVRDPMETCFSNLRELFSDANPYSYDQIELADYHAHYSRLMAHWHTRFPGRILDVDYARLTATPEVELRRVADFCGVSFQPAMLRPEDGKRAVVTASAVQVRAGVDARRTPKWLPYAHHLQPMIDRLSRPRA